jgi:hypothetical protein
MDMAPPKGGWSTNGRLRIQFLSDTGNSKWQVRFNGVKLKTVADISEPYENPYKDALGDEESLLAWTVPVDLVQDGINRIDVRPTAGKPPMILHLDLAIK